MLRVLFFALIIACLLTSFVQAGQGPQNVAVVINSRSALSMAVGHYYAQLRGIPSSNLIYLDWDASPVSTDVDTFRHRILEPIMQTLVERRIEPHITTIAYSADFPYVVDYKSDLKENSKVDPTAKQFHQGSLTGLTYLADAVLSKNASGYTSLASNHYYRSSLDGKMLQPTTTLAPGLGWNQQGEATKEGRRYLMSTMLAYTSGRGNSLAEVERYLTDGLRADGTYPSGTIYYLTNQDIRTRTRKPNFASAVQLLERLGVSAEVIDGNLPRERGDIMGAMIGTVDYRFAESGSHVRGGAICENLTSFGGIMREDGGQTALSECLRAGAAGSSGTVTEPYAIQAKFPHPLLHVHYAQGCALAEAFYQSVQGPYQLLVVGDPLCRPWATIPQVTVAGLPRPEETVTGQLTLTPAATTVASKRVGRYELYVDGILELQCEAGGALTFDTAKWVDGAHELRVVGYEASEIATQGEAVANAQFANHNTKAPTLVIEPANAVSHDGEVLVQAASPGATELVLYYGNRPMGAIAADKGAWKLPAARLGLGTGAFRVIANPGPMKDVVHVGREVPFEVLPPPMLPALAPPGTTKPGLKVLREGKDNLVIERLSDDWLQKAGVESGEKVRLESIFRAERDDLYQLQVIFSGEVELLVDEQSLGTHTHAKPAVIYVPVSLAAGFHRLEIRASVDDGRRLQVSFGNTGTQVVTQALFHHVE